MISRISAVPDNMVAFLASGKVTREDFDRVIFPAVDELVQRTGELNYLLKLDTSLQNFSMGAWMQDIILGMKEFTNWKRVAIVVDSSVIQHFTNIFGWLVPGTFKGFDPTELETAISWVASGEIVVASESL